MFSANENLVLRQHKRRIVQYVEETIPESVLDAGTSVMAMQISCNAPGCVPLETAIAIIFPRLSGNERLMEDLEESRGGTFKTKILMPMSEVTKDDVLDALPPAFLGGRRSMEKMCFRARDVAISQIEQLMGEDDRDGKALMVDYLIHALKEYVERGCVPPEFGEAFPKLEGVDKEVKDDQEVQNDKSETVGAVKEAMKTGGNFVIRRVVDDNKPVKKPTDSATVSNTIPTPAPVSSSTTAPDTDHVPTLQTNDQPKTLPQRSMEWRQKQKMDVTSSESIIQQLAQREHAPGVRRRGCPCCDPDNPINILDMMML